MPTASIDPLPQEALDTDKTGNLDLLPGHEMRVEAGAANTVRLHLSDRCYDRAVAVWAFPFTDRRHWIAFRDADEKPIGMLADSHDLDKDSRATLIRTLERRYFLPKVTRVFAAKEEFGLLTMDVDTDRGRITFTVNNPRENVHWIGPKRILFIDAEENRYEVASYDDLDAKSQGMLSNVV